VAGLWPVLGVGMAGADSRLAYTNLCISIYPLPRCLIPSFSASSALPPALCACLLLSHSLFICLWSWLNKLRARIDEFLYRAVIDVDDDDRPATHYISNVASGAFNAHSLRLCCGVLVC